MHASRFVSEQQWATQIENNKMETKKVHNQGKEKKDEINLFSHDSERILFFEKMCWRSQSPF